MPPRNGSTVRFLLLFVVLMSLLLSSILILPPARGVPSLPFTRWGEAKIDGNTASAGWSIYTQIDGVNYNTTTTLSDGTFSLDCLGNDTHSTAPYKNGGVNGESIIYWISSGPARYAATETDTFSNGGGSTTATDLNFPPSEQPAWLRINELVVTPAFGNDYVFLLNPSDQDEDLSAWRLEDNDGWVQTLTGSVPASGTAYVDLNGDILEGTGDELKLVWDTTGTSIAGGSQWVVSDRIEYGHQVIPGDNTTMIDHPDAPDAGMALRRTPINGTDTDDCASDLTITTATSRPSSASTSSNGTLLGIVKDADTSNAIPSVEVIATNEATDVSTSTTTDQGGSYSLDLEPGTYTVSAVSIGYEAAVETGILVQSQTARYQNFSLTPKALDQPPTAVVLSDPVSITTSSVLLEWSMNLDGDLVSYQVHSSKEQGFTLTNDTRITTLIVREETSYNATGLQPNTTYYFRISVWDVLNLTAESNEVSATTLAEGVPGPSENNTPPAITSWEPQEDEISVPVGTTVNFSVEVDDPDGNIGLGIMWSINDNEVGLGPFDSGGFGYLDDPVEVTIQDIIDPVSKVMTGSTLSFVTNENILGNNTVKVQITDWQYWAMHQWTLMVTTSEDNDTDDDGNGNESNGKEREEDDDKEGSSALMIGIVVVVEEVKEKGEASEKTLQKRQEEPTDKGDLEK